MKVRIIFVIFALLIAGCAHLHMKTNTLGVSISDRETKMFHSRNKSVSHHVELEKDQIAEISKILGRDVSFIAVNYKSVYGKKGGNKRGTYKGNLYKLEKASGSTKIGILLGIHKGKIAEIKLKLQKEKEGSPYYSDTYDLSNMLAYFIGHSFTQFSNDLSSLMSKGTLDNAGGAYSHQKHITETQYKKEMADLIEFEKKYNILSFIKECLATDEVIN